MESAAWRHVGFVTDNRLDSGPFGLLVELQGAKQIAVIGERQRVHAQRLGPVDQSFEPAGAVQQAEMAVAVKMDKRRCIHGVV